MRRQLQEAALRLFRERGYDNATAAEIAAEVGVTERTFFRYFQSKRDVLFDEAALLEGLSVAIANAPTGLAPMDILAEAFRAITPLLENNRPLSEPARELIAATPALRERHLAKMAEATAAVADALERRGIEAGVAALAAASGMAVISHAMSVWFTDPLVRLSHGLERAFQEWRRLSTAPDQSDR